MSVVSVRSIDLRRIGYDNIREWKSDPNNVYIGRQITILVNKVPYLCQGSQFCNPYKLYNYDRVKRCLDQYEEHLREQLNDPEFVVEFLKLRGKNLGCWCKPNPCHGDIILRYLKSFQTTGKFY